MSVLSEHIDVPFLSNVPTILLSVDTDGYNSYYEMSLRRLDAILLSQWGGVRTMPWVGVLGVGLLFSILTQKDGRRWRSDRGGVMESSRTKRWYVARRQDL